MKNERTLESAFMHPTSETNRGTKEYASEFGMTPEEFDIFLRDKDVLDLGSGTGTLAIEQAYRAKTEKGFVPAKKIDSLNIRYSTPDYEMMWREETRNKLRNVFENKKGREAVEEAKARFIGLDWHQLDVLSPDGTPAYDAIVSIYAFPYYSDFTFAKPENQREYESYAKREVDSLTFGKDSQQVLKKAIALLRPNGTMLLQTDWPYWAWSHATPSFQKDFIAFFNAQGCDVELLNVSNRIVIKTTKLTSRQS